MIKQHFLLFIIVILAGVMRFWHLGAIPPALTWDETAWGYNAYSIGIDGKDEFGRFLPLDYLESFGDFKPPLYAYLTVIPVKLFGLNEFATRFPSALFGVFTVLVTYFLVKRIFAEHELSRMSIRINTNYIALLSSFFLAISPWHINLSRAAFEANVATFFLVAGVWLFLWGIQGRKWMLILSTVSFVLSLYVFNTARIVAPILVLILALAFSKKLLALKKQVIIAAIIGIILILPMIKFLLSPQASLRFREVNIFSDASVITTSNQEIANDNNTILSKIIHNRRFAFTVLYLKHYFDNLNPNFLFIKGDGNPKFSTQDVGELYLWELPFFVGGFLFLFKQRIGYWWIVPLWMIIGIVPAGTARETPHALRIETTLPTFQIITAIGAVSLLSKISNLKYRIKFLIFTLCFLFLIFNVSYYIHGYYVHYPREYSGEWQYGYKDSIAFVNEVSSNYDEIQMTTELGRPYMYYLFYLKTDPKIYRKIAIIKRDAFGFVSVERFGKYYFAKDLKKSETHKKVLYVNTPLNIPQHANILKTFFLLNGNPVLIAYTL